MAHHLDTNSRFHDAGKRTGVENYAHIEVRRLADGRVEIFAEQDQKRPWQKRWRKDMTIVVLTAEQWEAFKVAGDRKVAASAA